MQGYNKYYPPEYDGKTSLNKLSGKSSRAKQIVRFEAPFDFLCESCRKRIGQGSRYNAEKKKVGMYYTSPIYSFSFKCHHCDNSIVIETDPENTQFVITSGAQLAAKQPGSLADLQKEAQETDIFAKVERDNTAKAYRNAEEKDIIRFYHDNTKKWSDTYGVSQKLRSSFRIEKKRLKELARDEKRIQDKLSLSIPIAEGTHADTAIAKQTAFKLKPSDTLQTLVRNELDQFSNLSIPRPREVKKVSINWVKSVQPPQSAQSNNLIDYSDSD